MIDDELYQKAADELDSEHRRPRVWARACALADDDHDEARYLYTNLRVEELLAELEANGGQAVVAEVPADGDVEPEAVELGELPEVGDGRAALFGDGAADDEPPRPVGRRGRLAPDLENDPLFATGETVHDLAGEPLAIDAPRAAPHDGRDPEAFEVDARADADDDEIAVDDTLALEPMHGVAAPEDPRRSRPLDDLDRLDEAYRAERRNLASPSTANAPDTDDDDDALVRELRRQAEDLPDERSGAIIAHESPDTRLAHDPGPEGGHERAGREAHRDAGDGTDTPYGAGTDPRGGEDPREPAAGAGAPYALADGPLEIIDERGGDEEYAVFVDASGRRVQAVRQGGSWGALLASVPWLLYRRLVGTAIVYVLFAVVVLVGLAATALAWQEAGETAALVTKAATIGFALLAVTGLLIVPFRNANHWREDKLERRGFELTAYVRTRDPERAIALARQVDGRTDEKSG